MMEFVAGNVQASRGSGRVAEKGLPGGFEYKKAQLTRH